ncbi:F-box protein SKIP23 isoform X3 [Zea mays]|uniref:KIB1-4 beta-propeller domain-containing protein n=1 Tax=Zea mays TaxID=4577 RepID=A0A804N393_MAIZE|nr:F-box protein SKIP23 isoform X3 [Zea mays]
MVQPPGRRSLPDWRSGLPEDLLESIGKRLASGHDAAAFRSACSPWRAAVPFAIFGPLLLLPFDADSDRVGFYCVSEKKVFSKTLPDVRGKVPCGSSCGWLALMDEAAAVTLLNPFAGAGAGAGAGARRIELPPAGEHVAAASSSEPVYKVHGRWVLRSTDDYGGDIDAGRVIKLQDMRDVFFREIVLSAPPDAGSECVAMAMLGCSTEVAFCRVGVDNAWTLLDTKLDFSVASIVHCQDKFLAIDYTGEISVFSSNAGAWTLLPSLSPPAGLCHRSYLESNGELHIVGAMVSTSHETQTFTYSSAIYACNLHDRTPEWSRVKDIGDQTLFVSKHFNGSFSGTSVSEYKENTIYFSEPLYGDPYDMVHRLEIVDVVTGRSEVKPVHEKMQGSEILGWIRPNLWKGGNEIGQSISRTLSKKSIIFLWSWVP